MQWCDLTRLPRSLGSDLNPSGGEVLAHADRAQQAKTVVQDYLANLPGDPLENGDTDSEEV